MRWPPCLRGATWRTQGAELRCASPSSTCSDADRCRQPTQQACSSARLHTCSDLEKGASPTLGKRFLASIVLPGAPVGTVSSPGDMAALWDGGSAWPWAVASVDLGPGVGRRAAASARAMSALQLLRSWHNFHMWRHNLLPFLCLPSISGNVLISFYHLYLVSENRNVFLGIR